MFSILKRICNGTWSASPSTSAGEQVKTKEHIKAQEEVNLLSALGKLMEQYPTALLGTERLPASKQKMKAAIKEVWRQYPKLRTYLDRDYMYLSQFQDGIGDAILDLPSILDFKIPTDAASVASRAASVAKLKDVIKEMQRQNPKLSGLDIAKLSASKLWDEIRDVPPDPTRIPDADKIRRMKLLTEMSEKPNSPFKQWRAWEKVSMAEMEILMQEWEEFKCSNGENCGTE